MGVGIEASTIAGLGWIKMNELELQKIAKAWIEVHHRTEDENGENFWAYMKLADLCDEEPELCWKVIHLIRQLDGSEKILSNLAAGPVEDLLVKHGNIFIDRVEVLAKHDPQFRKILGAVWQQDMPDPIWKRIKAVAGPTW